MRTYFATAVTLLLLSSALPAWAEDDSGHWKVFGHDAGYDFTLDCKFQQSGQNLTGACVDGPTGSKTVAGGRAHPLIRGQVSGDSISWTYVTNKGFFKSDVDYSGVTKGDHASGRVKAFGTTGTFTADRLGS